MEALNNQNQIFSRFPEGDVKKLTGDKEKQIESKENNENKVFSRFHADNRGDMKKLMDNKKKQVDYKDNTSNRITMTQRLVLEDVDTVADDFINNFKNQLKLEREESLKRFQDMIARGT